jgi:hypothetical protein
VERRGRMLVKSKINYETGGKKKVIVPFFLEQILAIHAAIVNMIVGVIE